MMELLPTEGLIEISKVLTYGAKKYGAHNWRNGLDWSRLIGATFRHLVSWLGGERTDPESGLSHLAHAGCNILMLIEYNNINLGRDDRWKREEK